MSRYTRLERTVMDALAWDLRDSVPDLAGQFEESLPGVRRNTGAGLSTEMIVGAGRPSPAGTTGALGTVHVLFDTLADPVAFRARLRDGRLLALEGDSYGQDTSGFDFATAAFDQVFTVDAQGRSIEFDPRVVKKPASLLDVQQDPVPLLHAAAPPPPLVNTGALQRVRGDAPRLGDLIAAIFSVRLDAEAAAGPVDAPVSDQEQTTLLVAVVVGIVVLGLALVGLFRVPLPFVVVAGFVMIRVVSKPSVLRALARGARNYGRYSLRAED